MTSRISKFGFNTFLIKTSKWLFLGLGLSAMMVTLVWPYVGDVATRGDVIQVTKASGIDANSALTMVNTQILGRDREQRLVEINAKQARPSDTNFTQVGLDNPNAQIDLGDGESLAVKSSGGTFDRDTNELKLEGDVVLSSSGGYDIKTQEAKVSLTENSFETNTAVSGVGPTGTLQAEGMAVDQETGKVVLKGKSKLVFDVKAIKQQGAKSTSNNQTNTQSNDFDLGQMELSQ